MRVKVAFSPQGWDDYVGWSQDKRTRAKIDALIGSMMREPFGGLGHPEPLRGWLTNTWSRKIDEKNRIVYRVRDGEVEVVQCRGHYDDH